jgi:hypothetical protein
MSMTIKQVVDGVRRWEGSCDLVGRGEGRANIAASGDDIPDTTVIVLPSGYKTAAV